MNGKLYRWNHRQIIKIRSQPADLPCQYGDQPEITDWVSVETEEEETMKTEETAKEVNEETAEEDNALFSTVNRPDQEDQDQSEDWSGRISAGERVP